MGDPPDNFSVVMAAKYWGVPPWEMMHESIYWIQAADDYANAERHRDEVRAREREKAQSRK